ncbi:hypothetical protein IAT38_006402 [Cryptococcus sp. DSM 104549]
MSSAQEEPHHPLLKAAEIEAALKPKPHFLNPKAVRNTMCMSDAVGMKSLAIHRVRLDPDVESTKIHYHLNEPEWIYITSGTGVLLLIDASSSFIIATRATAAASSPLPTVPAYEIEEKPVAAGDFIGFEGGVEASRFAHAMRAGEGGLEYIAGGVKSGEGVNICGYPELGRTMVFEGTQVAVVRENM